MQRVATAEAAKDKSAGCLLQPPTPIFRADNWPTLEVQKTTLQDLSAAEPEDNADEVMADNGPVSDDAAGQAAWDDDGFDDAGAGPSAMAAATDGLDDLGGSDAWGDELDDFGDLGDAEQVKPDEMAGLSEVSDDTGFQMPVSGRPPAGCWVANSSRASDHIAAGGAASALQLLNRQIAACDFDVMKEAMMGCYLGSMMSVPGMCVCGMTCRRRTTRQF